MYGRMKKFVLCVYSTSVQKRFLCPHTWRCFTIRGDYNKATIKHVENGCFLKKIVNCNNQKNPKSNQQRQPIYLSMYFDMNPV